MKKHLMTLPQAWRPVGTEQEQGAKQAKVLTPGPHTHQEDASRLPPLQAPGLAAALAWGWPETCVYTDRAGHKGAEP